MEARWEILRVLTEFETYLRELTELLRPVAEQLAAEMQALTERNRAQLAIWEKYFQTHSVDTFQQEMFRASYLFTQEMQPDEVWIALWNFNMVGFWTEWFESGGKTVRIAYLGANLSFGFAAAHQVRPDAETLCAMMRALTGKDKLEILRRLCRRACFGDTACGLDEPELRHGLPERLRALQARLSGDARRR